MNSLFAEVSDFLEHKKDEMIWTLESLVNIESFTEDAAGVTRMAEHCKRLFETEGMTCRLVHTAPNGPTLLGTLGQDRPGKPIFFTGHMDTVFKPGVFASPSFRREDDKAFGPGVLDMKGGIVIALYVIKALNLAGYNERPIKIAFSGDEECGHSGSEGAQTLQRATEGGICAFNMETGLLDNALCYGRKGRLEARVTVTGVEAHAGNDFLGGINAIEEMSHKIIALQGLTNLERGTTVTCATIAGGSVSNAIPKTCVMNVECRFERADEMERFKASIQHICDTNHIKGTSTEFVYTDDFAPFECTEPIMRLWEFIRHTAEEYGLEEVRGKKLGGASDAAYIQKSGTPVICSIGIQGQWNHTTREYAILNSLVSRGKLISAAILNLEHFSKEALQ